MDAYENALRTMDALLAKDCQFALATAEDGVPSLRYVDTFFDGGCFYVVTYAKSRKVREIEKNPSVALCDRRLFSFSGKAYNIGHPLKPENLAVREKIAEAFKIWYFRHNDEADEAMCYLRIEPENGFFHADGTGYKMNFTGKTAETFPFTFNTTLTQG
jgi:hypothetical protein